MLTLPTNLKIDSSGKKKHFILMGLSALYCNEIFAHTINYVLDKKPSGSITYEYIVEGFKHILPLGLDHILFVTCVFFLGKNIREIILQASMFTIAHTITLGLATYGIINPPIEWIEPIIALSIVFLALENFMSEKIQKWRFIMIFSFGLVHGMGFASALDQLGMPRYAFMNALISFNIGVELGQIAVIMALYLIFGHWFSAQPWYRKRIVQPISLCIAMVAFYWTIQRIGWI